MATGTLPYAAPSTSGQYAADLDAALGAPAAGADLAVTSAWVQVESAGFPGWNGLGTELDLPGAVPDPSDPAVFDYPTLEEGLQAAVDMMLGEGPQTTPLETKFVTDLRSGSASEPQLIEDIRQGGWAGSGPDTYDADAIASRLNQPSFSVSGSPGGGGSAASAATNAQLTGIDWNPLSWPGQIAGSATSSLAGAIGVDVLKGILSLIGAGMIVYGGVLLAGRSEKAPATSSSPGPTDLRPNNEPESGTGFEPFPDDEGPARPLPKWMEDIGVAA